MNVGNSISLESRIRGAIYGALVGDALGVPVEFSERSTLDEDPVREMRSGGTWGQLAGTWSDDGALLLCTAEATTGGFSPELMAQLYVRWMTMGFWTAWGGVFDIGRTTRAALIRVGSGTPWDVSGNSGEEENGNGSLMRILPIGLRFRNADAATIMRFAADASRITHAHRRSQLACGFYSVIAAEVTKGVALPEAMQRALPVLTEAVATLPDEQVVFGRLLGGRLAAASRESIHSSGYVMHTLEAALWCALTHGSFREAVLAAVNLGSDTDTTGCVAGGLLGALYGYEAIPPEWITELPRRKDVDALLDTFVPACG